MKHLDKVIYPETSNINKKTMCKPKHIVFLYSRALRISYMQKILNKVNII